MSEGRLYIIPVPISEGELNKVLPEYNTTVVLNLRYFVVENIKTSRRFLRKIDREFPIDDSTFYEQDKHNNYAFQADVICKLKEGKDVGLMSESGYPGIADPGNRIVEAAQHNEIQVIPLVGPSSLLMALSASGMNGQGFTFNGYLPVKDPDRSGQLKFIVQLIEKTGFTQIFIETPYRNDAIFQDFLKLCPESLKLCIAYDVSGEKESIQTKSIGEWKKHPFHFEKVPCVFVLGR